MDSDKWFYFKGSGIRSVLKLIYFYFKIMDILHMYIFVHHSFSSTEIGVTGRWLLATMYMLGIEPGFSQCS